VIRKSIAFHGDAINTASRIQGKCNELGCDLLVSEAIKEGLPPNYITKSIGTYQLKGKDCKVNLYSIKDPGKVKSEESRVVRSRQNVQCKKARLPLFTLWLNVL
jgi:adenylate cyclase